MSRDLPAPDPPAAAAASAPSWLASSLLFALAGSPSWSAGPELTIHASSAGAATVAYEQDDRRDPDDGPGHRDDDDDKAGEEKVWKEEEEKAVTEATLAAAAEAGTDMREVAAQARELVAARRVRWPEPYADVVVMQRFADKDECQPVAAELVALTAAGAFSNGPNCRHDHFPTTDVPLDKLPPPLAGKLRGFLSSRVAPFICYRYGLPSGTIIEHDCFVVLYDADSPNGQRSLATHVDSSHFSFTILLNERAEFVGGGTNFEEGSGDFSRSTTEGGGDGGGTMDPLQGQGVVHRGDLRHCGLPITKGKRMLLVGFLQDRRFDARTMKHWNNPRLHDASTFEGGGSGSASGLNKPPLKLQRRRRRQPGPASSESEAGSKAAGGVE